MPLAERRHLASVDVRRSCPVAGVTGATIGTDADHAGLSVLHAVIRRLGTLHVIGRVLPARVM